MDTAVSVSQKIPQVVNLGECVRGPIATCDRPEAVPSHSNDPSPKPEPRSIACDGLWRLTCILPIGLAHRLVAILPGTSFWQLCGTGMLVAKSACSPALPVHDSLGSPLPSNAHIFCLPSQPRLFRPGTDWLICQSHALETGQRKLCPLLPSAG